MWLSIAIGCVIILSLGYLGVLPANSPVETAAEEVLKVETGVDIKLPMPKSCTIGQECDK